MLGEEQAGTLWPSETSGLGRRRVGTVITNLSNRRLLRPEPQPMEEAHHSPVCKDQPGPLITNRHGLHAAEAVACAMSGQAGSADWTRKTASY